MITEPKFVERDEQPYVAIPAQVTMQEFGNGIIPQLHDEVMAWLQAKGVQPAGAPFIRYHVINMDDKLHVELGWPVAQPMVGDERVNAGAVPAGRYATLTHFGHYSGVYDANRALVEWAQDNNIEWDAWDSDIGHTFKGRFEFYPTDPSVEPDPDKWETEVTIRVMNGKSA